MGKLLLILCVVFLSAVAPSRAQEDSPEVRDLRERVIRRRQADRSRRDVARRSRMAREAMERQQAREHAEAMAPVLAAQEAAWRRDQIAVAAVRAEQAQAVAALEQAEAARRLAAAISYRAWLDRGRRYP